MANQLYVNVGGTWKSADSYYVNVGGTWKTGADIGTKINQVWEGMVEAAMYQSGFPTYLEIATLDLSEFTVKPIVHVNAKQGIDNSTLDYAYWSVKPLWTRESTFVYSPPSGGGGTPTNNLPVLDETYSLDDAFLDFACKPTVFAAVKSGIDLQTLDYAEFTCKPFVGSSNSFVYTPPSQQSQTPQQNNLPQASDIVNLDVAYWSVYPQVRAAAKAGLDTRTLDLAVFSVLPVYVSHVGLGRIDQNNLQIHYDFGNTASWDGISSTTAINDLSGNNKNATLQGSSYTKDTANGGSILLAANTTNSRFDLATALTFTNTEDFTFFVCYKYISTPNSWEVFAGNNDGDNFIGRQANSYFRMQDGSNNNIDISSNTGGGQGIQSSNTNIRVLYVVKDNQTAYFYEDGVLSNGGGTNTSFVNITFSGNQYANSYGVVPFYEQKLYFWGIYDRALTATEIADNYAVHKTRLGI